MRSVALLRFSFAASATGALAIAATQLAILPMSIPAHHIHLAWTLAQVLIQL